MTPELDLVLMHAADAVTVQSPDGSLVYANQSAARTLGFESPEVLLATPLREVMSHYELLDEDGGPLPIEALPSRRALLGESGDPSVIRFRQVNTGDEHWSLVQAIPILDDAGAVRMVINTFQDITQLKRSEQRLRLLADAGAVLGASVDYQETLQELADLLVRTIADWCVVDIVETGSVATRIAVSHVDPAKRHLAEEIQRRYPPDPEDPNGIHEVIRTGIPVVVPDVSEEALRAAARDEQHFRLLQSAGIQSAVIVPLRARGDVLGTMTLIGSSARHRLTQADLPLVEELAGRAATAIDNARLLHEAHQAITLRDDFLAMASHDMRTPLAVILANLQLARRRLTRAESERAEIAKHLDTAERTTQKLTGLVGELMDISILRTGQPLPLTLEPADLGLVTQGVAAEYQRLSGNHEITMEIAPGVTGTWDALRVERVLRNVLDNALKYSPGGGVIHITVRPEGESAIVEISDHGVGIPDDEVPHLFEKFHRGSNTRDLRGTGLGLAGSLAIVQQLGGTIEASSRLGEGSTFRLRLPLGAATS